MPLDQESYVALLNSEIDKAVLKLNEDPTNVSLRIICKALNELLDAIDRGEVEPWKDFDA